MIIFDDELVDNRNYNNFGDGDCYGDGYGRGTGEDLPIGNDGKSDIGYTMPNFGSGNGVSYRFDETLNEYI